ncbi:MAG: DUF3768 domain-containing protein [Gammaproteobacteria bacterium]|nr:DUF3768 domain-containing protein [Gammaproteobacteria bacterium]
MLSNVSPSNTEKIAPNIEAPHDELWFDADTDLYAAHDMGGFTIHGGGSCWKIDCYDRRMVSHPPDTAYPSTRIHITTIMRTDPHRTVRADRPNTRGNLESTWQQATRFFARRCEHNCAVIWRVPASCIDEHWRCIRSGPISGPTSPCWSPRAANWTTHSRRYSVPDPWRRMMRVFASVSRLCSHVRAGAPRPSRSGVHCWRKIRGTPERCAHSVATSARLVCMAT